MFRTLRALSVAVSVMIAVAVAGGPAALPVAAAEGVQMSARVLLQGHARAGAWVAIDVRLQNDGAPVVGELRLQGGTQGGTRFSVPVDLPSPSDKRYTLYAQPPTLGQTIEVVLVAGNDEVARQKVAFTLHDAAQLTIGVVAAQPAGIVAGIQLPAVQNSGFPVMIPLGVEDLPERIEAWSALDRLIWQDVDSNTLSTEQVNALRGWLALGGRLVVVGGTTGPGVLSGFPDAILPYRPTTTVDVAPESLAALLADIPDEATDVPAMGGELAKGRALVTSGDRVIAADAPYGSGSVTVIGVDPTVGWIAESKATTALWRNLIPARSGGPVTATGDDSQIVGAVSDLPALQLPPIGGMVLLLFGYIALIGPVNYLVLKRLDKREWAWVTMPALIAIFAAGAYAYGSALRGSDVIINEVAIVRGAPDTTEGAAQVYLGVFSPTRGTYQVAVTDGALLSAPVNGDFFGGQGTVLDVTQSVPARVRNLSVGFGSLRTVRAETQAEVPLVHAELRLVDGVLTGTIRNDSTKILEAPAVVLGGNVVVLPDIAPNQTGDVNLRIDQTVFGSALGDKIVGQAFFNDPVATNERQRRNQTRHRIISQLTYDPMFGSLSYLNSDVPVLLAWGRDPILEVEIEGQRPTRAANALYYIPLSMDVRGTIRFGADLMRSTTLSADAGFFSRDPYTMSFGKGTVTLAYRPIPFGGTLTATAVRLQMGFGGEVIGRGGGVVVDPVPPELLPPAECDPEPCPDQGGFKEPNDMFNPVPETEVLDRTTNEWLRVPPLDIGRTYELKDPARFVDPATGTIQVRFVNEQFDSVSVSFNIELEGEVE